MGGSTFKTFSEQAQNLIDYGCKGDIKEISSVLSLVNYYRLSAYWYPFRKKNPNYVATDPDSRPRLDELEDNTSFREILSCYDFDKTLKLHAFEAIERIEVALRTKTAYYWCASRNRDPNPQKELPEPLLERIQKLFENSKEECIRHQKEVLKKKHVKEIPVWTFVELTTFADLQQIFTTFEDSLRERIANAFGFKTINSFTSAINLVREARNVCAHYARFWNKSWTILSPAKKVKTPVLKQQILHDALKPGWNPTLEIWEKSGSPDNLYVSVSKTFATLIVIASIYKKLTGKSEWAKTLIELIKKHAESCRLNVEEEMGLVGQWEKHPAFA